MSELMGDGAHEAFLWETASWGFMNSENSGGASEEKSGEKARDLSPSNNNLTVAKENEPTGTAALVVVGGCKKRGGGKRSENKGSGGEVNELGGKGGGGESDHEIHIWTERERRKKMRNMFSNLHALLPQLPPKADKSTIVDEAVSYIKTLQNTLQKLQKQKLERLHGVTTSINCDAAAAYVITPQTLAVDYSSSSREAFLADQGSSSNINNMMNNNITTPSSSNSLSIPRFGAAVFQTWTSPNVILNVCGEDAHISVCSARKPGLLTAICYVLEKHKLEVVSAQVSSDNGRSMYMIQAHASSDNQMMEANIPVEEIYKQAAAEIMLWVNSS
ncbi:hypothetical protein LguiA_008836 [Lonicera macranthoides]